MLHRYLVLGLLTEGSMSGYDIRKHVKATLKAVTNASYGTLYPVLHKLLAEGAVEMKEVPQSGRPAKKVYCITERGRQDLEAWLRKPPTADQGQREFLLKLYLARHLSKPDILELVKSRRCETEALLAALQVEKDGVSDPQQEWVIDYTLALYQAEVAWLEAFEARIGAA